MVLRTLILFGFIFLQMKLVLRTFWKLKIKFLKHIYHYETAMPIYFWHTKEWLYGVFHVSLI